jgi:murein endopeptidase
MMLFVVEIPTVHAGSDVSRSKRTKRIRLKKKKNKKVRRRRARRGFRQLTNAPGFIVTKPARAWGRTHVLAHLRKTFAAYHAAFPDSPPMVVHDISRRWGGRMRPHRSHRRGTDVDIRLQLSPPSKKYLRASPRTLDIPATWFIISRLLETRDIVYIFIDYRLQRVLYRHAKKSGASEELLEAFQYPRGRHRRQGIIRHTRGHADHMHVRFRSVPTARIVAIL